MKKNQESLARLWAKDRAIKGELKEIIDPKQLWHRRWPVREVTVYVVTPTGPRRLSLDDFRRSEWRQSPALIHVRHAARACREFIPVNGLDSKYASLTTLHPDFHGVA